MKILPFRGAEKFLGPASTSVAQRESVVQNEAEKNPQDHAASISLTTEKKLVKIGVDPNLRSAAKQDIDHVSIHEKLKDAPIKTIDSEDKDEIATRVYLQNEVEHAYNLYLKELENINAVSAAALASVQFVSANENQFELHFQSQPQIEYFNEERAALFAFFRNHSVVGVQLIPKLAEQHSEVKEFLTDRQRFEKMMAQNPTVEELWRRFKLVID